MLPMSFLSFIPTFDMARMSEALFETAHDAGTKMNDSVPDLDNWQ
jgi:hypothetical protein